MAKLTAGERNKLSSKSFAVKGRKYPIEDESHARNALARVSQHGSSAQKKEVRAAVHRKFPGIGHAEHDGDGHSTMHHHAEHEGDGHHSSLHHGGHHHHEVNVHLHMGSGKKKFTL